jgi:mRNA interferase MazF
VVVSRQAFVASRSSSVVCAPVSSTLLGLSTEVSVGPAEGLKHASAVQCDRLVSIDKSKLTGYVGALSVGKLVELRSALRAALAVE